MALLRQTIQLTPTSTSPEDLYAQWETDLGVSGTLVSLDGDDSNWTFALASPALVAGASHGEFSSEGMLGWSGSPKAGNAVPTNFNRMYYAGGVQPDMLLGFRLNGDMKSVGVKLQKAAGDTIIGGYIQSTGEGQKLFFAIRLSATLSNPPVFCVRLESGGSSAYVSGLRIAPGTQNFASLEVLPGTTGLVEFGSIPVGAFYAPLGFGYRVISALAQLPGPIPSASRGISALRRDIHFGGTGRIEGTVKEKGQPDQPLVRRVLLISENTNLLVAETWSDATGNYRFEFIDPAQRYTVVSYDHEHVYRAVIADNLTPELMP